MFKTKRVNQTELADKLGMSRQQLNNILTGNQPTSLKTAIKIQKASNGEIKASDLLPEIKEAE